MGVERGPCSKAQRSSLKLVSKTAKTGGIEIQGKDYEEEKDRVERKKPQ